MLRQCEAVFAGLILFPDQNDTRLHGGFFVRVNFPGILEVLDIFDHEANKHFDQFNNENEQNYMQHHEKNTRKQGGNGD